MRKLRYGHASMFSRAKAIRVNIYAGFIYGIKANVSEECQLLGISAAVIDICSGMNDHHETDWFYTVSSAGSGLDLVNQLLIRRLQELRRAICKGPYTKERFKEVVQTDVKHEGSDKSWYKGVGEEQEGASDYREPAPHPSKRKNVESTKCVKPKGPVGLLVQAVRRSGTIFDKHFNMWQSKEEPVDVLEVAYQHLGRLLMDLVTRARTRFAKGTKGIHGVLKDIGRRATNASVKKLIEEQIEAISAIGDGGVCRKPS